MQLLGNRPANIPGISSDEFPAKLHERGSTQRKSTREGFVGGYGIFGGYPSLVKIQGKNTKKSI